MARLIITYHDWPEDTMCSPPRPAHRVFQLHREGWGVVSPEADSEREARDYAAREYPEDTVDPQPVDDLVILDEALARELAR